MKKSVQVKYADFVEVFDVDVTSNDLQVALNKITDKTTYGEKNLVLDLAHDIREDYSIFPFESGDVSVIQIKNVFIISVHVGEKIHWIRFDSSQIISYLIKEDIVEKILPFINEDEHIYLNSLLSDFIRTDYSFSSLNKKIKFGKVAVLMSFVKDILKTDFSRVLLDETVIGDVEMENIALSFRFADRPFLKLVKIDNLSKIIVALEKEKHIPTNLKFTSKTFFINNRDSNQRLKLIFSNNGSKFDYEVLPQKNYVFDLGEKEFAIEFNHLNGETVTGKVCIFNGDERDLMIN